MALLSQMFGGDPKLEAAAVSDPAHILQGARGPHVGKIQLGLILLDGAALAQDSVYGPATAAAVREFKQKRRILNYQGKIDDIVGKKTIAALDAEMLTRERKGGGGLLLNQKIGIVIHMLVYFSGWVDTFGMGGKLLEGAHGQDVLTDMENLDASPDTTEVVGFGGSLNDKRTGVDQAMAQIDKRDRNGQLIIYGYSAGGINSLDLCRALNTKGQKVNLLVTVDVSGRGEKVDRTVPPNVMRNRNYFQTDSFTLSNAIGGRAIGSGVINIDCNNRNFEIFTTKTRHGQMQDITRFDAIRDMRVHIKLDQIKNDRT